MSSRIFLGYQFPITTADPNEDCWQQQQKLRGQRHAIEWQGQEKKSASDNRSDRDSNLNVRAARSIVSVRKSRSEAKSSKPLQREWNLDCSADRTYNRILWNTSFKVFVSTVNRVHTVHRLVRGNTTVMRPSIFTWENFLILTRSADPSVDRVSRRSTKHRARIRVRVWVLSLWKCIVVIVFLVTPSPLHIVWWIYLVVNKLL